MSMHRRTIKDMVELALDVQELPLHLKYRPTELKGLLGQTEVVNSLAKIVASKNPGHAYLFTGPAGTGKTTSARVLAAKFGCDMANVLEIDAATNSGVDAMRDVMSALRYQGFGSAPNKAIIVDECHALSKQAWSSLLKPVEEPPAHVYIFFCTTESGKVPEAIVTRCHSYQLKSLKRDDVLDLLDEVVADEGMQVPPSVLDAVATACNGSARQALVMLSMVRDCTTPDEAQSLLESPLENKEVIDLCRLLLDNKLDWKKLTSTLKALPDMSPESVRIVACNYLAAVLMSVKREGDIPYLLTVLTQFSKPFNISDKQAPLLLAFGNVMFPE